MAALDTSRTCNIRAADWHMNSEVQSRKPPKNVNKGLPAENVIFWGSRGAPFHRLGCNEKRICSGCVVTLRAPLKPNPSRRKSRFRFRSPLPIGESPTPDGKDEITSRPSCALGGEETSASYWFSYLQSPAVRTRDDTRCGMKFGSPYSCSFL